MYLEPDYDGHGVVQFVSPRDSGTLRAAADELGPVATRVFQEAQQIEQEAGLVADEIVEQNFGIVADDFEELDEGVRGTEHGDEVGKDGVSVGYADGDVERADHRLDHVVVLVAEQVDEHLRERRLRVEVEAVLDERVHLLEHVPDRALDQLHVLVEVVVVRTDARVGTVRASLLYGDRDGLEHQQHHLLQQRLVDAGRRVRVADGADETVDVETVVAAERQMVQQAEVFHVSHDQVRQLTGVVGEHVLQRQRAPVAEHLVEQRQQLFPDDGRQRAAQQRHETLEMRVERLRVDDAQIRPDRDDALPEREKRQHARVRLRGVAAVQNQRLDLTSQFRPFAFQPFYDQPFNGRRVVAVRVAERNRPTGFLRASAGIAVLDELRFLQHVNVHVLPFHDPLDDLQREVGLVVRVARQKVDDRLQPLVVDVRLGDDEETGHHLGADEVHVLVAQTGQCGDLLHNVVLVLHDGVANVDDPRAYRALVVLLQIHVEEQLQVREEVQYFADWPFAEQRALAHAVIVLVALERFPQRHLRQTAQTLLYQLQLIVVVGGAALAALRLESCKVVVMTREQLLLLLTMR